MSRAVRPWCTGTPLPMAHPWFMVHELRDHVNHTEKTNGPHTGGDVPLKRDTKNGPRRQRAETTLPCPNFAHGDRVMSAKPRGAARFCAIFICDALETDWPAEVPVLSERVANRDYRRCC
jgi:hypothetical protein